MTKALEATPEATRRVVHSDGWVITQIAQPDGEWWNIRIERLGDAR